MRNGLKKAPVERCYVRFGSIVNRMREERGITQQQIADALGWTRAGISNLEAGRQRVMLHDLPRIAKALRVSIRDLLDPRWR